MHYKERNTKIDNLVQATLDLGIEPKIGNIAFISELSRYQVRNSLKRLAKQQEGLDEYDLLYITKFNTYARTNIYIL